MACGCQKNKGNSVAANKVATATRPSNPQTNGNRVSGRKIEKRIIR